MTLLSHKWTLWAHLPDDHLHWDMSSYIEIATISTIEEIKGLFENLPNGLVESCMLFFFREGIMPRYEDPANEHGGFFSYKISNKHVSLVWKQMAYAMVGGWLSTQDIVTNQINGITISPKKNFCIIKTWMATDQFQNPTVFTNSIRYVTPNGCLFGRHKKDK